MGSAVPATQGREPARHGAEAAPSRSAGCWGPAQPVGLGPELLGSGPLRPSFGDNLPGHEGGPEGPTEGCGIVGVGAAVDKHDPRE
jgi:hypothetical protein